MNPVFGARRRAEEFNSAIEAPASSRVLPDAPFADLLGVVSTLRQAPALPARADFVSDLRSRLMLAAEGALAPAAKATNAAPAVPRNPRERRIAAAVGGFAILSATASMAVAAQTALPGDTLYPLKRAIENAHTGIQGGTDDKGTTMLGSASGRLEEVGQLTRSSDQDADVIALALHDFVEQANEASDLLLSDFASTGRAGSIAELRSFTAASSKSLTSLQTLIPDTVRGSLIEASQVVRQIDELALSACPTCSDLPLTAMPTFASQQIPTLIRDVLDATAGSPPAIPPVRPVKPGKKHTQPTQPTQPPPPPTDVAQPTAPTKTDVPDSHPQPDPTVPDTGGVPHGPKHNPLGDVAAGTSNGQDPLGDLLTGTGELIDGAVGALGITKPLG